MTEFIEETKEFVKGINKEVAWIGSDDGKYQITWKEFLKLEEIEYDDGYGAQEIASDLIIVFSDRSVAIRSEYDGSEGWDYHESKSTKIKRASKKFTKVCVKQNKKCSCGWEHLGTINGDE